MQQVAADGAVGGGEMLDSGGMMLMPEHPMMGKERSQGPPPYYGGGGGGGYGPRGGGPSASSNHQQPRIYPSRGGSYRYSGRMPSTPGGSASPYPVPGGGRSMGYRGGERGGGDGGGGDTVEENKIFVGSLPPGTTKEALSDLMKKFGTVDDVVIMMDRITGASRGFGFVTFTEASAVNECMQAKPHVIDGHEVDVRRAIPRGQAVTRYDEDQENKIFIGGIPDDLTEEKITSFLSERFGAVKKVSLMRDKNTGRPRGFGFVTFLYAHSAVNAVGMHDIEGTVIEAKKAEAREQLREERNRRRGPDDDLRGRGLESNGHSYRPMVSGYGYPGPDLDAYGGPAGGPMRRAHFSRGGPCGGDYGEYGVPVRHPYAADPYAAGASHPSGGPLQQPYGAAPGAAGGGYGVLQQGGVNPYGSSVPPAAAVPGAAGGSPAAGGGSSAAAPAASMYPGYGSAGGAGDVVAQAEYGGGGAYGMHPYGGAPGGGGAAADYETAAAGGVGGAPDPYDVRNVGRRPRPAPAPTSGYARMAPVGARAHPYA